MGRERIDLLMVERGLAPSRDRAKRLLLAGAVLVDEVPVDKAGTRVSVDAVIRLRGQDHPYVGRGGLKMEGALEDFGIEAQGRRCLDVGASTGGFTDCLLQRGASEVVAVDVGTHQLHWRLLSDARVRSLEQTDVRDLTREQLGGPVSLVVMDASFISLRLLLGPVRGLVDEGAEVIALVKPQFEVGRAQLGRGGVVRDEGLRDAAVQAIADEAVALGFSELGRADCRITGARGGNQEVFLWLRAGPRPAEQRIPVCEGGNE